MGIIQKIFGGRNNQDPLDKLELEDDSLEHQGIANGIRVWYTPDGDGIGLYYFDLPPDLPSEQATVGAFCAEYEALMQGEVVETGIEKVADLLVVRAIGKAPQSPSGITYVGSYTVPFRDFSYVIKIQCEERDMTGVREAVLFDKGHASGELKLDESGTIVGNFSTDDAIHDDEFPDHPLSRCRRGLRTIASSLHLNAEIRSLPKFELPSQ